MRSMPSCDLQRSEFQNPPGPGVLEEELWPRLNRIGAATTEGLTEMSDVQKISRACLYSVWAQKSIGRYSFRRDGLRARVRGCMGSHICRTCQHPW